jgi:hypothetical protein
MCPARVHRAGRFSLPRSRPAAGACGFAAQPISPASLHTRKNLFHNGRHRCILFPILEVQRTQSTGMIWLAESTQVSISQQITGMPDIRRAWMDAQNPSHRHGPFCPDTASGRCAAPAQFTHHFIFIEMPH